MGNIIIGKMIVRIDETKEEDKKFIDELEELCQRYAGVDYFFNWELE